MAAKNYKVGDKVRIKKDLVMGRLYGGVSIRDEMNKKLGEECRIVKKFVRGYEIDIIGYLWTDEMLEPVEILSACLPDPETTWGSPQTKIISHDFAWAVKQMKEGKKVWMKVWKNGQYWFLEDGEVKVNARGTIIMVELKIACVEATDWEIYCPEHNWEEHGCASPVKKFGVCSNCGLEKEEVESLSDEIEKQQIKGAAHSTRGYGVSFNGSICSEMVQYVLSPEKVKHAVEKLKSIFDNNRNSNYTGLMVTCAINKIFGEKLA